MIRLMIASVLCLAAASANGQEVSPILAELESFELFADCQPIYLTVFVQADAPEVSGLTEERVKTVAESRLRAARLYESDIEILPNIGMLHVAVYVQEQTRAAISKIEFLKPFSDQFTGQYRHTGTWETNRIGIAGVDGNLVMQGVSEMMDEFINEYLRVNEQSCE